VEERVERTLDITTPGFGITAVAATTRLLCNEEADVMVLMRARTEAATAKNTTFVEGTVPDGRGLGRRWENGGRGAHLHRKQLSPLVNM